GGEFAGVNVESAAYPLGQCAEMSAIGAAATAGYRPGDIAAIGINASPCGGCRQRLHEWRIPEVSFRRSDGTIATYDAAGLLPDTWDLPGGGQGSSRAPGGPMSASRRPATPPPARKA